MHGAGESVKIAVTIGPSCQDPEVLKSVLSEGVDAVRVNASHADPASVADWVALIRKAGRDIRHDVAIMLDLQGIKRRIGDLAEPVLLKEGEEIWLAAKADVARGRIPAPLRSMRTHLKKGTSVFLDDGFLRLEVISVGRREVRCRVLRGSARLLPLVIMATLAAHERTLPRG